MYPVKTLHLHVVYDGHYIGRVHVMHVKFHTNTVPGSSVFLFFNTDTVWHYITS